MIGSLPPPLLSGPRPPARAATTVAPVGQAAPHAGSRHGAAEAGPQKRRARPPAGAGGADSAVYLAQLLGQQASPGAGRGQAPLSARQVETYDEVARRTRRIELLFGFEGLAEPVSA
ncbi:MAG: hypothetical protein AB7P52_12835 [Alphaproteobacteria bacterium]